MVQLLREDPEPLVRLKAALAIGRRDTPGGKTALIEALDDPDHRVFVGAADSLILVSTGLGPRIVSSAAGRPSPAKQRVINVCLKRGQRSDARDVCLGFADDADSEVRLTAIRTLAKVDHGSAVEFARRELPHAGFVESATYKNILAKTDT